MRVSFPGRHLAGDNGLADGRRPGPDLGIGFKGHRSNVVGVVAVDAMPIEDRRDVMGERRFGGGKGAARADRERAKQEQAAQPVSRPETETGSGKSHRVMFLLQRILL